MIYTNLTEKAMAIAYKAHHGQTDKAGVPYIFHPCHVAEQMVDEATTCAALLHDVIEDTEITLDFLRDQGFEDKVITAVELLTHNLNIPYLEYIENIKSNAIAKAVKIADIQHNSDPSRSSYQCMVEKGKIDIYKEALKILEG